MLRVLPHGKGTLDERPVIVRWIKRFEVEWNRMQQWEREREKKGLAICRAKYNSS
ncbi:MAG: hypothetical protein K9L75_06630 [Spirochaetia bacterium]|nr:hypothetical protein [Spirochaetia bacterium]